MERPDRQSVVKGTVSYFLGLLSILIVLYVMIYFPVWFGGQELSSFYNFEAGWLRPEISQQIDRWCRSSDPLSHFLVVLGNLLSGNLGSSPYYHTPLSSLLSDKIDNTIYMLGATIATAYLFVLFFGKWQLQIEQREDLVSILDKRTYPILSFLGLFGLLLVNPYTLMLLHPFAGLAEITIPTGELSASCASGSCDFELWDRIIHLVLPITICGLAGLVTAFFGMTNPLTRSFSTFIAKLHTDDPTPQELKLFHVKTSIGLTVALSPFYLLAIGQVFSYRDLFHYLDESLIASDKLTSTVMVFALVFLFFPVLIILNLSLGPVWDHFVRDFSIDHSTNILTSQTSKNQTTKTLSIASCILERAKVKQTIGGSVIIMFLLILAFGGPLLANTHPEGSGGKFEQVAAPNASPNFFGESSYLNWDFEGRGSFGSENDWLVTEISKQTVIFWNPAKTAFDINVTTVVGDHPSLNSTIGQGKVKMTFNSSLADPDDLVYKFSLLSTITTSQENIPSSANLNLGINITGDYEGQSDLAIGIQNLNHSNTAPIFYQTKPTNDTLVRTVQYGALQYLFGSPGTEQNIQVNITLTIPRTGSGGDANGVLHLFISDLFMRFAPTEYGLLGTNGAGEDMFSVLMYAIHHDILKSIITSALIATVVLATALTLAFCGLARRKVGAGLLVSALSLPSLFAFYFFNIFFLTSSTDKSFALLTLIPLIVPLTLFLSNKLSMLALKWRKELAVSTNEILSLFNMFIGLFLLFFGMLFAIEALVGWAGYSSFFQPSLGKTLAQAHLSGSYQVERLVRVISPLIALVTISLLSLVKGSQILGSQERD